MASGEHARAERTVGRPASPGSGRTPAAAPEPTPVNYVPVPAVVAAVAPARSTEPPATEGARPGPLDLIRRTPVVDSSTAPARSGTAVLRRKIVQDPKSGAFKIKGRVPGHDSTRVKKALTLKLLVRKAILDSGGDDLLNPHEKALLAKAGAGGSDIVSGQLKGLNFAICHKLSSDQAQQNVLTAIAVPAHHGLFTTMAGRVAFNDWGAGQIPDATTQGMYDEYKDLVEEDAKQAWILAVAIELGLHMGSPPTVKDVNDYLKHVVNTPLNFFIGNQSTNGMVSFRMDLNHGGVPAGLTSQDEDYPIVPQTPESRGIYDDPVADEHTLSGTDASGAGHSTRLFAWSGTVPGTHTATSSMNVPTPFQ